VPTSNEEIIQILNNAGIVAVPTDTVLGLAIDPENKMAVQKLYHLKRREAAKPLVYLVASRQQLGELVQEVSPEVEQILAKYWPGALTVIFKKKYSAGTIGVRIPRQEFMLSLLRDWGRPLGVTSANISGKKEIVDWTDLKKQFGAKIDYYAEFGGGFSGVASTVIDVSAGDLKVLRQGEIVL